MCPCLLRVSGEQFQDAVTCSRQERDPPLCVGSSYRLSWGWNSLPAHRLTLRVSGVDRQAADTPGTSQSPSRGSSGNSFEYRQSLQSGEWTLILLWAWTFTIVLLKTYFYKKIIAIIWKKKKSCNGAFVITNKCVLIIYKKNVHTMSEITHTSL